MKLLIILSLCAAAMADMDAAVLKQHVIDCAKLTKLNPDDVDENLKVKSGADKEQVDCFGACIDRKLNILDEDGKFNIETALSVLDEASKPEVRQKLNDILEKCKEHEKDPCKYSACYRALMEATPLSQKE